MSQALHQPRLEALPELFRQLMQAPLHPLRRGALPVSGALYVFYLGEEAVGVGSPPHIDEARILAPSVRLGVSVSSGGQAADVIDLTASRRPERVLHSRWLVVPDDEQRMLLELYCAQYLGVSPSHPGLKQKALARG